MRLGCQPSQMPLAFAVRFGTMCTCRAAPPRTGALGMGVHMNSKHLKSGLPFLCVIVSPVVLFSYAGAVQNKVVAAASMAIPVDCSFARGIEGEDFMRDGQEAHCRM